MPWIRRILLIGCGLAVVQQATGINTVNYYAPTILEQSGLGASASLVATIAVGVTSVTMTILGIFLLGIVNRRRMLITGFTGVAVSQAALALVFLLPSSTSRSYIILACMVLFVAFVQCWAARPVKSGASGSAWLRTTMSLQCERRTSDCALSACSTTDSGDSTPAFRQAFSKRSRAACARSSSAIQTASAKSASEAEVPIEACVSSGTEPVGAAPTMRQPSSRATRNA